MTTITNFIEGNFISNPQANTQQRPIWILDGHPSLAPQRILQSLLWKCGQDKKPLVILDLGLSSLKRMRKATSTIVSQSGVEYVRIDPLKPVYLVKTPILDRSMSKFLLEILHKINTDVTNSQILKKDREPALQGWGLVVQGLQAFTVLTQSTPYSQSDIQAFVGALSSISILFRQIVIFSNSKKLSLEINFALQKISTCLTRLKSFKDDKWECISTVRRYTGYFKQEQYTMILKDNRIQVSKWKAQKQPDKTEIQDELFRGLGFKPEKTDEQIKKNKQLREMIFPHLKVQNQGESKSCSNCDCKQEVPEDLIVLDEEQEDDEDLDV